MIPNVFKVTRDDWSRILQSSVMDEFRGFWATKKHLYGHLLVYGREDAQSAGPVIVFRVGVEHGLEVCADMGNVFDSAQEVRFLDAGEKNGTEWAEWSVQSERGDGRLRTEFDRCVDASRLLSPGWRLRGWLQLHGIGSGEPIERLLQEIPRVTFINVPGTSCDVKLEVSLSGGGDGSTAKSAGRRRRVPRLQQDGEGRSGLRR